MTSTNDACRIHRIAARLCNLTPNQRRLVENIIARFEAPKDYRLLCRDVFDECMLQAFGDALLVHHCLSDEPFSKDKFEYVMVAVASACGHQAKKMGRTTPGHDITLDGVRISLKTQADTGIRHDELWISKFMELGKGKWGDDPEDLRGLLQQFLKHLTAYDRILSLRNLSRPRADAVPSLQEEWFYELVEIPKGLLQAAASGRLEMDTDSRQNPKPGRCYVTDMEGNLLYQLYFDGGGERKLQIQRLQKASCTVHATWRFPALHLCL